MPLFNVVSSPPFHAILIENWNAPAHRYFLSYRSMGIFRHLLGFSVVDEFASFSTPIFFGPVSLLGKLYNTGITLGHQRNPDMPLDQGWPPLCIGIEPDDSPKKDWEADLLHEIKKAQWKPPEQNPDFTIQHQKISGVDVFATDAPLLPRQLQRLCQLSKASLSIAFSTGNRITGQNGKLLSIRVASEATLDSLFNRFSTLL